MEPEAPPTVPRSVSDEDRDGRIVREHREKLAGELSALIEDQGRRRSSSVRRGLPGPKRMIEVTSGGASYVVDVEQYEELVKGTIEALADEHWPAEKRSAG